MVYVKINFYGSLFSHGSDFLLETFVVINEDSDLISSEGELSY